MRSAARLTYAQAQAAFDGKPDAGMTAIGEEDAGAICGRPIRSLTIARDKRDPLDLDLPERRIDPGRGRQGRLHRLSASGWNP